MITRIASSPISLTVTKFDKPVGDLALALQMKVVLSAVLRGSKVRVLVNDGLEPVTEEMITLVSLLDKCVLPLSQMISIAISVSVASLMEMLEVRMRGTVRPAKRGPGGIVMTTSGVETAKRKDIMTIVRVAKCTHTVDLEEPYFGLQALP